MRLPSNLPQIRSGLLNSSPWEHASFKLKLQHAPLARPVLLVAAGACALTLLMLSGCASRPVVLPEMAVAESAVRLADNPSTAQNAPAELLAAKDKLRAYGIAPPQCGSQPASATGVLQFSRHAAKQVDVPCPQCGSHNTTQTAPFGSTACKALYRCLDCLEPFDYFKPY